jgi:ABC-type antimicrobial peptide transport system permease subunit
MHLYSLLGEPAGIRTVRMFQWVALVILVIACINYVNLVTARASKRHREIGLKKVHGAGKFQLFMQLISEAAIMFIIAVLFALALNKLLLPFYNSLSGKEFELGFFDVNVWKIYLMMFLSVVVLAGIFPAFLLASYKEVNFARSIKMKQGSAVFRKILVFIQFVASTVLIAGTFVLLLQMKYMREKDFGYDRDQVLMCNLLNMRRHHDVVKAELARHPSIIGTTIASGNIMQVTSLYGFGRWEGKTSEEGDLHNVLRVDTSFVKVMGITLISGSDFTSSNSAQYIINESSIKSMGFADKDDPVGKWTNDDRDQIIVGVAKNFHFESLHKEIGPLVLYNTPGFIGSTLYIRVSPGNVPQAISALRDLWSQYNPDYAFDYWFLDDTFNTMYKAELQTNKLFSTFSIIAILISCLGLFGLVVFTAELKTKEIGIRKVHGANIPDIIAFMLRDFLILVGTAILIAIPLSYYLSSHILLDSFAFRITLSWRIFAVSGIITVILTLLTVSWMAIKAATKNPVDAIMTGG